MILLKIGQFSPHLW